MQVKEKKEFLASIIEEVKEIAEQCSKDDIDNAKTLAEKQEEIIYAERIQKEFTEIKNAVLEDFNVDGNAAFRLDPIQTLVLVKALDMWLKMKEDFMKDHIRNTKSLLDLAHMLGLNADELKKRMAEKESTRELVKEFNRLKETLPKVMSIYCNLYEGLEGLVVKMKEDIENGEAEHIDKMKALIYDIENEILKDKFSSDLLSEEKNN